MNKIDMVSANIGKRTLATVQPYVMMECKSWDKAHLFLLLKNIETKAGGRYILAKHTIKRMINNKR